MVSLSSTQTYYAIAGQANGLESDQLRISLTQLDAESGSYITFLTQGEGRQVLLTEVFGGQATAIVETSRFLAGELVYQGSSLELASALAPDPPPPLITTAGVEVYPEPGSVILISASKAVLNS